MDVSIFTEKYKSMLADEWTQMRKWEIFEYLVAIEMNMLHWRDAGPVIKKKFNLPTCKDFGVDVISCDFTKSVQVKHSSSARHINWSDLKTFINYNTLTLKCVDATLVITPKMTVDSMISRCMNVIKYDYNELFAKHVEVVGVPKNVLSVLTKSFLHKDISKLTQEQLSYFYKNYDFIVSLGCTFSQDRKYKNSFYLDGFNCWTEEVQSSLFQYLVYEYNYGEIIAITDNEEVSIPGYILTKKSKSLFLDKNMKLSQPEYCSNNVFMEFYKNTLLWIDQNQPKKLETIQIYYQRYEKNKICPKMVFECFKQYLSNLKYNESKSFLEFLGSTMDDGELF
jgi:hypothetical protein